MTLEQCSVTHGTFQLIQYTMKLVTPVLLARARLQHRVGLRKEPTSSVATSFTNFSGIIGDFKMLGRFWGKWSRLFGDDLPIHLSHMNRYISHPAMDDILGKEPSAHARSPHD